MFSNAIVRKPGKSISSALTKANLGKPDYYKALEQHGLYVQALKQCGLKIEELAADEDFPDSTFVEDTALLTPRCAIITNPGAPSRRGETVSIKEVLQSFYPIIEQIESPATVEAGDIMMSGNHFFIGLSERTNREGAEQLIAVLKKYGMSGSFIKLEKVLHLKTAVSYLEKNDLVACRALLDDPQFSMFNIIDVPLEESYAANCLWINDFVLLAKGYPKTAAQIQMAGYEVIEVDVSEFRKVDGGLSCLSLRF